MGANASSPETIVNTLVDVVLPSICGAVDDITGNVDMVHLLRTLPSIVGVYNALDVPALAAYVGTEMHAFLESPCAQNITSVLGVQLSTVLASKNAVESGLEHICMHVADNPCAVQFAQALGTVDVVNTYVGHDTLLFIIRDALPILCSQIDQLTGFNERRLNCCHLRFSCERLRGSVGGLLAQYIPEPPSPECRSKLVAMTGNIERVISNDNPASEFPSLYATHMQSHKTKPSSVLLKWAIISKK